MEKYLGKLFGGFSGQTHQGAAFFELLPAWLRFLEKLGLLEAARREKAIADLRPLAAQLKQMYEDDPDSFLVKWRREWGATTA